MSRQALKEVFRSTKNELLRIRERSLVAQRLIVDHVRSVGGVTKVEITKELLLSAAGARQKYHGYLDEEKRKKEQ